MPRFAIEQRTRDACTIHRQVARHEQHAVRLHDFVGRMAVRHWYKNELLYTGFRAKCAVVEICPGVAIVVHQISITVCHLTCDEDLVLLAVVGRHGSCRSRDRRWRSESDPSRVLEIPLSQVRRLSVETELSGSYQNVGIVLEHGVSGRTLLLCIHNSPRRSQVS